MNEAENMIIALRTFIVRQAAFEDSVDVSSQDASLELEVRHLPVPVPQRKRTKRPKQRVQNKPIKKTQREESSSSSDEESEELPEKELVTPWGELPLGIVASEKNKIR